MMALVIFLLVLILGGLGLVLVVGLGIFAEMDRLSSKVTQYQISTNQITLKTRQDCLFLLNQIKTGEVQQEKVN